VAMVEAGGNCFFKRMIHVHQWTLPVNLALTH
jgi:hypothetical protein